MRALLLWLHLAFGFLGLLRGTGGFRRKGHIFGPSCSWHIFVEALKGKPKLTNGQVPSGDSGMYIDRITYNIYIYM